MFKRVLRHVALLVAACSVVGTAGAELPSGPMTLVVGFEQGGGGDTLGRELARRVEAIVGNKIIVENIGGGAGSVAADAVARRSANGATFALTLSMAHSFVPLSSKVNYSLDSFTYLASISATGTVLAARSDRGYTDTQGLIAKAKKDGFMAYGSLTPLDRMIMQEIARINGFELDVIPGKGGSELRAALIAGDVEAVGTGASGYKNIVEHDKLQPLATFGSRRIEAAPEMPTLRELGYDLGFDDNFVLFAPAGLDDGAAQTLRAAILEAAAEPALQALIRRLGSEPIALDGVQTREALEAQIASNRKLLGNGK